MLQRIALLAIAAPRRIIAVAVLVMLAAAIFGVPVAKSLSAGGFQDPTSESAQADPAADRQVPPGRHADGDHGHRSGRCQQCPAARAVGTDIVDAAEAIAERRQCDVGVDRTAGGGADLVSKDGKSGLVVAGITGGENDAQTDAQKLADEVARDHPVGRRASRSAPAARHGVRADQRADAARPAADGVDRGSAQLPGVGLGVRRPAGRGTADGGRRCWRSWARWRCCGSSPSPPMCRSSR